MTIDLTQQVTTFDGDPIYVAEGKSTAKDFISFLLYTSAEHDKQSEPPKKYERYLLIKRIHNADKEIKLTSEEITDLKMLAGKCLSVLAYGRLIEILENE